jgi:hypothetical protein
VAVPETVQALVWTPGSAPAAYRSVGAKLWRFLTPWLRSALVGVNDHARNQLIQLLAARSANSPRPTPYSFDTVIGRPKQIVIGSKWLTFLRSNHLPLRAFAQLSVARYFETRNPGIINKLDRPGIRKMEKARAFWDTVLSNQPLQCIYSGERIRADYDLDHFLPWSFVRFVLQKKSITQRSQR